LIRKGEPAEAVQILDGVVKADPQSALKHYWLGRALEATNRRGEALEQYAQAHALDPCDASVTEALARVDQ
jgi:cytochrome c-type biogenesis protein CcmH/NrfG